MCLTPSLTAAVQLSNHDDSSQSALNSNPRELLILHLDVGQGESTLLIERENEKCVWCCIIDGGWGLAGRGAIIRYLRAYEVTKVDLIVCTHFDGDHTKGLVTLFRHHVKKTADLLQGHITVSKLLVRTLEKPDSHGFSDATDAMLKLTGAAGDAGTDMEAAVENGTYGANTANTAKTTLTCIHAKDGILADENDGSIAMIVSFGNFRYYTAGDLPTVTEDTLNISPVHAFKCGHHGSRHSSSPDFLKKIKAQVAFISCGDNAFGHPTFDVLDRLADPNAGIKAFYLTNSIHNHWAINAEYLKFERTVYENYIALLNKRIDELGEREYVPKSIITLRHTPVDEETVYNNDRIDAAIEAVATLKSGDIKRRLNGILKSMQHAAKNASTELDKQKRSGYVSGSNIYPGTVILRAPFAEGNLPVEFQVLLYDDSTGGSGSTGSTDSTDEPVMHADSVPTAGPGFKWHSYTVPPNGISTLKIASGLKNESANSEDVAKRLEAFYAKLNDVDFDNVPSSPYAKSANEDDEMQGIESSLQPVAASATAARPTTSVRTYRVLFDQRSREYVRFTKPAVKGAGGKQRKVFLPFCNLCKRDIIGDVDGLDVEIIDVQFISEEDDPIDSTFHRICFNSFFKRLTKYFDKEEEEEEENGALRTIRIPSDLTTMIDDPNATFFKPALKKQIETETHTATANETGTGEISFARLEKILECMVELRTPPSKRKHDDDYEGGNKAGSSMSSSGSRPTTRLSKKRFEREPVAPDEARMDHSDDENDDEKSEGSLTPRPKRAKGGERQ